MKGFHILPINEKAINFVSMMVSYSGVIRYIPTQQFSEMDSITVFFHDNSLFCSIEVNGKYYEGHWNGIRNAFEMNITTDMIDPKYICGYIGDEELELLYNLFVNKRPIIKGNKRAAIVDTNGLSDLVCTNCTLESLIADNSFFGKNPLSR